MVAMHLKLVGKIEGRKRNITDTVNKIEEVLQCEKERKRVTLGEKIIDRHASREG